MRKNTLVIAVLLLSINIFSQQLLPFSTAGFHQLPQPSGREVFSFNNGWYFYKGDLTGAQIPDFKQDVNWQPVQLPHGTELLPEEASGGISYLGITWYRKMFRLPTTVINKKISLHFEAIMGKCKIWINGTLVADHKGGYLPVIFDLPSSLINKTADNLIAVMADNSDDKSYPPGKTEFTMDFSYFGGIYRDAWLVGTNEVHITDANTADKMAGGGVFVHYDKVSKQSANVLVTTDVINESSLPQKLVIETYLKDKNNKIVASASKSIQLAANNSQQVQQFFTVKNPALWHPDMPNLYQLYTVVKKSGNIVDGYYQYIGIRSIEFKGKEGFWLNGEPFNDKLVGSNHHQDFAYIGNAVPNNLLWRDAKKVRDAGIRILRLSHYPQDPAFMEACDRLGIFTIVPTPGWQFWNNDSAFANYMYDDVRQMIRRDRNHSSVIMWEPIPNETGYPENFARKVYQTVHEEYPYTGCYAACDYKAPAWEIFDVIYAHPSEAIHKNLRQCTFTREWGDGSFIDNWNSQNASNRAPLSWGETPQLKQIECFIQPKAPITSWETLYNAPKQHVGGCQWHFFDTQRGYHPDEFYGGVVNAFRQPKYAYWLFQSQQNPQSNYVKNKEGNPYTLFVAHDMNPWSPTDVTVLTNCDSVRLITFGRDTIVQTPEKSAMPHAPIVFKQVFDYLRDVKLMDRAGNVKKSNLIVEGIVNGKVVISVTVKPAKRAARIKLVADMESATPQADGSSIIPFIAYIHDENDNIKRLNNEYIRFSVEGEGRIVGDESIMANPRKIEWGAAPVLIKTTLTAGKIKITATPAFPGLQKPKADTLIIEIVAPTVESIYNKADTVNAFPFSTKQTIGTTECKKTMTDTEINKALKETEKGQEDFEGLKKIIKAK